MDRDERCLDDSDGHIDSFRRATLRIQTENQLEHVQLSTSPSPADDAARGPNHTELAAMTWSKDDVRVLFSFREGLAENALQECVRKYVQSEVDGDVIGSWLLTEISIWDAEKERLVILTKNSLIVVKYDFIALKSLEARSISLQQIDTLIIGDLIYPKTSLVPRINGLASGVSTVLKSCLFRWSRNPTEYCPTLNSSDFEPRNRNMQGIRIMWNNSEPLSLTKQWNPFTSDIPFLTFTSHPLLWHKGTIKDTPVNATHPTTVLYDVAVFSDALTAALEESNKISATLVQHQQILLHNYLSLGSIIHNKNSLGFFKMRGRFSF